ncbi:MAG: histidine kinase, partial [Sandarakinorhabdus sp.]|nr:histidine kinase [Sandarakinorhabdus sp.]
MLWLGMAGLLRLRPAAAALFGAGLVLLVMAAAAAVFARFGLWVGPAAALAVLLLAQPTWAWRRPAVGTRWVMDVLAELGQGGGA